MSRPPSSPDAPVPEAPAAARRAGGTQAPQAVPERRALPRRALRAPLLFSVLRGEDSGRPRAATTCNVSPGGLFFRTHAAADLRPEQRLRLRLLVPRPCCSDGGATVALCGEGRVVRTETPPPAPAAGAQGEGAAQPWGVAVQFAAPPQIDLLSLAPSPLLGPPA